MTNDTPEIFVWDIERCSIISRHYDRWNTNIRFKQTIRDERMVSFAGRWLGEPKSKTVYFSEWGDGRDVMLQEAWDRLDRADGVVGWNSRKFDRRAVNRDFFLAGMTEPSNYVDIDLMVAAKRKMFFSSFALANVCRELGIQGKLEIADLDQLTEDAMAGDEKAQRLHKRYNLQDVHVLADDLYYRFLPWIPASMHPNMAFGVDMACPRCGSDDLERRGFHKTLAGTFRKYRCRNCGHWPHESKRVATTELRPA